MGKEGTKPMKNIRIGTRFTQINKADRVKLSKVSARLERENIKAIMFNDEPRATSTVFRKSGQASRNC